MPALPGANVGVRIAATARYLPERVLSNADLEKVMDTSDEWIVQRTGVKERRIAADDENVVTMAADALAPALDAAGVELGELDLLILATVGAPMTCPSAACQVLGRLSESSGPTTAGAFDLTAACSGFVYGLNIAHDMIRGGAYKNIAVVGAEQLSNTQEYSTRGRGTAIIFGDGAGAAVLRATDDTSKGVVAQSMHSNGSRWHDLFIPLRDSDYPEGVEQGELPHGLMRMNGRGVFKFAVGTFSDLIAQTLEKAGVAADEVDHFICHQSNVRILEAARDRFGIPEHKMPMNIGEIGNTSAASVPILFDGLSASGKVEDGQKVMFVAFGGGLTWTSSLWQF
ncbi:MAG: beta-ketoacyl-ACP synthase III [Planctomycetota bacterium]